jgi:hypothetical protein
MPQRKNIELLDFQILAIVLRTERNGISPSPHLLCSSHISSFHTSGAFLRLKRNEIKQVSPPLPQLTHPQASTSQATTLPKSSPSG